MTNSRVHRKFRLALLRGDVGHVQQVVNGHATSQKLSQQEALADLMCYIYEDDCCGSGVLYLAAGCKMSDRKLQWWTSEKPGSSSRGSSSSRRVGSSSSGSSRGRGRRPCVFDYCIPATDQHISSSGGSSAHNAAAVTHSAAAAAAGQGSTGYLSVFRGWYSSSSSSSSKPLDPDAGRVAILSWMSDVMLHSDGVTWLPFDMVNTRMQTALHLCLLNNGSPNVLKLLLDLSSAAASSSSSSSRHQQILQQAWGMTDAAGCTPLNLAIRFQDWQCAGLMIAAGAAAVSSSSSDVDMAAAEAHVAGLLPGGLRPKLLTAAGSSSSSSRSGGSSIASLVGGLLTAVVSAAASSSVHSFEQQLALSNVSDRVLRSGNAGQIRTDDSGARSDRATAHSSNVSAVADELKQAVQHVSYVTNVPAATALSLLATNGYDLDQAIKAASGSSSRVVGSSNVVVEANTTTSSSNSSGGQCIVCFENIMTSDQIRTDPDPDLENDKVTMSVQLPCGHITCDSCWRGIVTACIQGLGVHRIGCAAAECGALLPLDDVERLVKPEVYQQYLSLLVHHMVNTSPQRQWCPAPGCGRTLKLAQQQQQQQQQQQLGGSRGFDVRCACGCDFCWLCQEPAHEPAPCQQVLAWRQLVTAAAASAEHQTADWVAANTRCCPRCHSRIQRDGGCNHMTCRVCSQEFCWVCGRDWSQHSQSTGGYYACTLQPTAAAAAAAGREESSPVSVGTQQQQQQLGSVISSLLGSAVTAVRNVVLSHKQKLYLGMYLQQEVDLDRLRVLLMYQQLLLAAVLWQQQQERPCTALAAAAAATPDQQQQQEEVTSDGDRPVGLRSLLHVISEEQQQQHMGQQQQQQQQILDQLSNLPPIPPSSQQQQQQDMQISDQQQSCGCDLMSDDLRSAWLGCLSACKHTLRWSCVQGYYLKAAASRRQLEHLQDRLAEPVDQLLAVIQQLPGAQHVVERAAAVAARHAAAAGTMGTLTRTARSLWGKLWQQLGYSSVSSSGGGGGRAAFGGVGNVNACALTATSTTASCRDMWFDIPADLLEKQVYYVLAVSKRFHEISGVINQAYICQDVMLSAARQGLFDDPPSSVSAAATGSSRPGDVSQGPQVTIFDVVAAGSDPEVLYDALSAGVGQLWRSFIGG